MLMIHLKQSGDKGGEVIPQKVQKNMINDIIKERLQSTQFSPS